MRGGCFVEFLISTNCCYLGREYHITSKGPVGSTRHRFSCSFLPIYHHGKKYGERLPFVLRVNCIVVIGHQQVVARSQGCDIKSGRRFTKLHLTNWTKSYLIDCTMGEQASTDSQVQGVGTGGLQGEGVSTIVSVPLG